VGADDDRAESLLSSSVGGAKLPDFAKTEIFLAKARVGVESQRGKKTIVRVRQSISDMACEGQAKTCAYS
jgi:hypothetical protein